MPSHEPGVSFSTLVTSSNSRRKNTPCFSFGQEVHKERSTSEPGCYHPVPGPGAYQVDASALHNAGPLIAPSLFSNTRWAADRTSRTLLGLPRHKYLMPPGPGLYLRASNAFHLTGSTQQLGKWRNATRAGWQDYSRRECQTPLVLSREHERERFGTHSPGPMTAAPQDSVGKQLTSNRKTQPRCAFGRSERFASAALKTAAAVPGPGAYNYS